VTAIPAYHGKPPTISSRVFAGTLTVTARCPAQEQNCRVTLKLTVPSREHVIADSGQADVRLASLAGGGKATAGQGNITLTGIAGTLTAQAGQGSITATGLAVRQATLKSGQSTIDASFSLPPALVVATCQMGSVTLHLPGNSSYAVTASAEMGSASVRVPQSAGSPHVVRATSQMGSVTVVG
jgi:hypothetical protein